MKSTSSQAKVLGTIVSISGAFVVTLYIGPPIIITHAPSFSLHQPFHILKSVDSNWAIGGLLLTAEYILVPLWYIVQVYISDLYYRKLQTAEFSDSLFILKLSILQVQIMKVYPDELTVVFFYNLCVSIMAAFVGIFTEPNPSAWKIQSHTALASIVCSVRSLQK